MWARLVRLESHPVLCGLTWLGLRATQLRVGSLYLVVTFLLMVIASMGDSNPPRPGMGGGGRQPDPSMGGGRGGVGALGGGGGGGAEGKGGGGGGATPLVREELLPVRDEEPKDKKIQLDTFID